MKKYLYLLIFLYIILEWITRQEGEGESQRKLQFLYFEFLTNNFKKLLNAPLENIILYKKLNFNETFTFTVNSLINLENRGFISNCAKIAQNFICSRLTLDQG